MSLSDAMPFRGSRTMARFSAASGAPRPVHGRGPREPTGPLPAMYIGAGYHLPLRTPSRGRGGALGRVPVGVPVGQVRIVRHVMVGMVGRPTFAMGLLMR